MADVTVSQFADVLKVTVEKLLTQLDEAGIKVSGADDKISDDAKMQLLSHLRSSHGRDEGTVAGTAAPRKITLKRKSQTELKLAGSQGRARTVNVEVRKKRTYVKRDPAELEAEAAAEEAAAAEQAAEEAAAEEARLAEEAAAQEAALKAAEEEIKADGDGDAAAPEGDEQK